MSEETPIVTSTVTDDLDAFSAEFFGRKPAVSESTNSEADDVVIEDETPAKAEPKPLDDDDTVVDDDDSTPEKEEVTLLPKKKKNSAQERIAEITGKLREAERKLAALENPVSKEQTAQTPKAAAVEDEPDPQAQLEDGTDKYPLGEFDPNYIRDLTKHALKTEKARMAAEDVQEQQTQLMQQQKTEIEDSWVEKLGPAKERYPDFDEKGQQLISTFEGIDAKYGEYLSATIMSMDYGTDVLYYLASNPAEAQKIVDSGPARASISLGRIEARFEIADAEKKLSRPKVSKAPEPVTHMNKGTSVSKARVSPDTDDLDAFSAEFFKKRR